MMMMSPITVCFTLIAGSTHGVLRLVLLVVVCQEEDY